MLQKQRQTKKKERKGRYCERWKRFEESEAMAAAANSEVMMNETVNHNLLFFFTLPIVINSFWFLLGIKTGRSSETECGYVSIILLGWLWRWNIWWCCTASSCYTSSSVRWSSRLRVWCSFIRQTQCGAGECRWGYFVEGKVSFICFQILRITWWELSLSLTIVFLCEHFSGEGEYPTSFWFIQLRFSSREIWR